MDPKPANPKRPRWVAAIAVTVAILALPASAYAAVDWPDLAPIIIPGGWLALFAAGATLLG